MARPRKICTRKLRALIEAGLTVREMAPLLHVTTSAVYTAFKRDGLPVPVKDNRPRVQPWCPPELWGVYRELQRTGMTAAERRAVVELDIKRMKGAG